MRLAGVMGKRVVIVGLAREGTALALFLAKRGVDVTVTDTQEAERLQGAVTALAQVPVRYALGGHPQELLEDVDVVFVSPGVPPTIPFLAEATARGIPLSSQTRLFAESCPAPIIGITGSNGKTTTAALVADMLGESGWNTKLGGNIGEPMIGELDVVEASDRVVMELSSYQLELFGPGYGEGYGWSPAVAAVLNVTPNHLDRHGTMSAYRAAKAQIMIHQRMEDCVVLAADDPTVWAMGTRSPARAIGFSTMETLSEGAFLHGDRLMLRLAGQEHKICTRDGLKLLGSHNVANMLAACTLAGISGAEIEGIRRTATRFAGVPHRLELVRVHKGVCFYNDSIATTPERAMAGVRSFESPLLLLAGGRDKHLPWDGWADLVIRRVKHLLLFGEGESIIERSARAARARSGLPADSTAQVHVVSSLEWAVAAAAGLAESGDVVLLSPGGSSFDGFTDFVERGDTYRSLVESL